MVLFWLMSIVFPLVLRQRKGHLAHGSYAGQGRNRDCSLTRWTPMFLRDSTVVGPQGRDTRVGFAPGCFTLAAASFVNLCGSSPFQCPCAICPGCAGGDRETLAAPTGDAAIGTCCRSPLWFSQVPSVVQSHFPISSLSLPCSWSSPPQGNRHKACSSSPESFIVSSLSFSVKAEIQ